ncbi:hypothetical protein PENSPDRAFT_671583 [Peniophora sp. CONT]|nr:hypothetical protein PENSPDRAFT_671583 [Peniophora sp. CONT]
MTEDNSQSYEDTSSQETGSNRVGGAGLRRTVLEARHAFFAPGDIQDRFMEGERYAEWPLPSQASDKRRSKCTHFEPLIIKNRVRVETEEGKNGEAVQEGEGVPVEVGCEDRPADGVALQVEGPVEELYRNLVEMKIDKEFRLKNVVRERDAGLLDEVRERIRAFYGSIIQRKTPDIRYRPLSPTCPYCPPAGYNLNEVSDEERADDEKGDDGETDSDLPELE